MKKLIFSILAILLSFISFSQKSWVPLTSEQPLQSNIAILSSDRSGLLLEVTIPGMFSEVITHEEMTFQRITLDDNRTTKEVGRPELPMLHKLIGIPGNQKIRVSVLSMETKKLQGYFIYPFQTPTTDNPGGHNKPFVMDKSFYQKNAVYPLENFIVSQPGIWRDVKVAGVEVTPFNYNPVTKELQIVTRATLKVEFYGTDERTTFNPKMELTPKFYQMYSAAIENFDDLGYTLTYRDNSNTKYLIITNNEAVSTIQPLIDWKNQMGHKVELKLIEPGFNTPQHFKTYITELYNNQGLEYILMVGDAYPNGGNSGGPNVVPMFYWAPGGGEDPSYSDSWYTCMDGPDDHYADLAIGRFVYNINQLAQLQLQIQKTLNHYMNPDLSSNWAENTILIAHKENYPGKYTQCCEEIRTFPYALQTPIFEKAYGGQGYSNAQVVNYVNTTGCGIFNYRGHGSTTELWQWTTVSPMSFTATQVAQLTNPSRLFVFFDVCCDNMDIVSYAGECLCESFMKHSGASVAVNGAIIPSYTIPNHDYDKEMYKAVYHEGITNIGYVTNFANLTVLNVHGNIGRSNVRTYLWLGDSSLEPWTKLASEMTVTHDDQLFLGLSEYPVQVLANGIAVENAMVCVSNEEGSVYAVGYTDGTGFVNVQFDSPVEFPGEATVTVTKFNCLPYQATIPIIPQDGPYVVKDSWLINDNVGGNGNGLMDYAESILLTLSVKNVGTELAQNVNVTLSTTDPYIIITNATASYGNIGPNASVSLTDAFAFDVAENIPDNHSVLFAVTATDGTNIWNSNIVITGRAPVLAYDSFTILDPNGNNNGKIDPGEEATIVVTVKNTGSADATGVLGLLSTNDAYLQVTQTGAVAIGNLTSGDSGTAFFSVYASQNAPAGHSAELSINITADHNLSETDNFNVIIGQIPVVIICLDPNHNSGPKIQTALNTLGITSEYVTSIPTDLNLFSSAFVCLGVYSSNHVLTTPQGQQLADFLNAGGSLYMEGGDTWYYNPKTPVHTMFKINGVSDGSGDLSTINGQTGTFTEGMSFTYNGDNNWIDRIEPIAPAVKIFQNQSPSYGTAVAYDAGTYKTIGASHEFGGLTDGASTKVALMEEYMNFFGLIPSGVTANFVADQTEICVNNQVQFTSNSIGSINEWFWEFQGGTPATSTEENPLITYYFNGTFNVSLTVTGENGSNTMTKNNYINVSPPPSAAATPTGVTALCQNAANTTYTTTGATHATQYTWTLTPTNAGVISGNGLTAVVDWDDNFYGSAEIMVSGSNNCGQGANSPSLIITIDPLPSPAGEISGDTIGCQGETVLYTVETIANSESYNWVLTPSYAGSLQINNNEVNITFSDKYLGDATLKVCGVNACGEGEFSNLFDIFIENCIGINELYGEKEITLYPNPSNGTFTIEFDLRDIVEITIINTLGKEVYNSGQLTLSGKTYHNIEIKLSDGVYYLKAEGPKTHLTKKLMIVK
ncbi:MAG TPA: C25 family cysteine peptidase [Bacteroidales bacterium]|nr:C25 family cysteine peptidase [Bacteroidales bacterium]HOG67232.1 C25 family cysteine peptidase [Bacteroidales bacterium]HPA13338.1 C25 family cysteine peptidase [Bacteroidales bacterium]HQO08256.1 C25 family cysteine peptidase [Bacteroidales bacterium]HQP53329.1 C25 family cysteine peptidase [Bacteroidales bacterium]